MGIKSNRRTTTASGKKKGLRNNSLLEVREPNPGETYYLTGNTECLQCIVVTEKIDIGYKVGPRYHPVSDTVSNALAGWIQPVLFQQAVYEPGRAFVYPQVLSNGLNEDWEGFGGEQSIKPAWHWIKSGICSDCHEITWDIGQPVDEGCYPRLDFREQLGIVLAPSVIDALDHPLVMRILSLCTTAQAEYHDEGGV